MGGPLRQRLADDHPKATPQGRSDPTNIDRHPTKPETVRWETDDCPQALSEPEADLHDNLHIIANQPDARPPGPSAPRHSTTGTTRSRAKAMSISDPHIWIDPAARAQTLEAAALNLERPAPRPAEPDGTIGKTYALDFGTNRRMPYQILPRRRYQHLTVVPTAARAASRPSHNLTTPSTSMPGTQMLFDVH